MRTEIQNSQDSLSINETVSVPLTEIEFKAVRSQGPGGQHVNKVNTAVQLRFDVMASSLPDRIKRRLMSASDNRRTSTGVFVIKGQGHRSQIRNQEDALARLAEIIREAAFVQKARRPTRPSRSAREKRLKRKAFRGKTKSLRGPVKDMD